MNTTAPARPGRRPIARQLPVSINGVAISSADIARETQHHASADPDAAWAAATRALAIRELLVQEADRLGIVAEPVEDGEGRRETPGEARLRDLLEREVAVPRAVEAECRRYYEQNRRRLRSPDLFEAAHILLPREPQSQALAARLIADLGRQPALFAEAAALHSLCPSAQHGGNLGQIGPGQTVAEFESALAGMTVGTVHPDPVESRYGLHIVRLDRHIEGRELPFEMVRERIAAYLDETVHRRAMQQYVSILAGRAAITGVDLTGSGPLVQ